MASFSEIEKEVLICLGERKRSVKYKFSPAEDPSVERNILLGAVRSIYDDVPKLLEGNLVLQLKDENWGEFVDLSPEHVIPHRSVLRVVSETLPPSVEGRAVAITSKLSKPTDGEVQVLGKLFPSSRYKRRPFDPSQECCASESKRKKKASSTPGRVTNVQVIMLKKFTPNLPRGKKRTELKKAGRILTVQFKRSMSELQAKNQIIQSFRSLNVESWTVMETRDNHLVPAEHQGLDGEDVINRKGSLYLCQKPVRACETDSSRSMSNASENAEKAINQNLNKKPILISSGSEDELPHINVTGRDKAFEETVNVVEQLESADDPVNVVEQLVSSEATNGGEASPVRSEGVPVLPPLDETLTTEEVQLEDRRSIIIEQDAEYQASVQVDQDRDMQVIAWRIRDEQLQHAREILRQKFAEEVQGGIGVAFRLHTGERVHHIFNHSACIKDMYDFIFAVKFVDPPFNLITSFPRRKLWEGSVEANMDVINVEVAEDSYYDPIQLYVAEQVPADVCGKESDFVTALKIAENERERYVTQMDFHPGMHSVQREDLFCDVLELYKDEKVYQEYPFRIRFEGERALDLGGVTRDMFSGFFEIMYLKLFNGGALVTPAIHPGTDLSILPLLGSIISHAYLVCGILPTRIALPALVGILCSNCDLPEEVILSSFIDSLSLHDRQLLMDALMEAKQDLPSFSSKVSHGLEYLLGFYQCREIPRPQTINRIVVQTAIYEFKTKPAAAIEAMRSGIPMQHTAFWRNMSSAKFYSIYKAVSVSSTKVLQMLDDVTTSSPSEEHVLSYLRQYIGNMRVDEICAFLRFVTGCSVCTSSGISVIFNRMDGAARHPLAHTCSCTLELPSTYFNYEEFSSEFDAILKAKEEAWRMDAL